MENVLLTELNYDDELYIDNNPKLIINNIETREKVLTSIVKELNECDEFLFAVAFLTMGGLQVLFNTLEALKEKGVKGKIVVSEYQNFTDPNALRRLMKFENIELKIVQQDVFKMHAKGYVFKKNNEYTIVVGSSNLTQDALTINQEWNVLQKAKENDYYTNEILKEFNNFYENATIVDDDYLKEYETRWKNTRKARILPVGTIKKIDGPNKMQRNALKSIEELRVNGQNKGLIISTTGTGKTILCALDVKKYKPKKFLFIVHREQISKAALNAFRRVLGEDIDAGLFGGGTKDNRKYVFSMIQTLSKDENLHSFDSDEFDYIVFDEVHRIGAETYLKVFNYFKPKFMLGMTATPERGDGFDIYKLFDYNIAYEIRLQDAMKEEMICPFHYYGVTDLKIGDEVIDDHTSFNKLVSDERVMHIIDNMNKYGYPLKDVRGLIFVSRKEEAVELSNKLNELGFKTKALTGTNNQLEREDAIKLLEQDEKGLDYIITVDIFNEGVDIPCINQIIMLRPTQSAIIFVQQLGRGLRLYKDKEYVVVIDFIANYKQNYMIPIALTGDNTYNKDTLRRVVREGNHVIYGSSTINFDSIAQENIFKSIDEANFNNIELIKSSYKSLKQMLGRIPHISDFDKYNAIDVLRIVESCDSYYRFLRKYEKDYTVEFSDIQELFIKWVSTKYLNGKKPHELEFIKILINKKMVLLKDFEGLLDSKYPNIKRDNNTIDCVINQMTNEYFVSSDKGCYNGLKFIEISGGEYIISQQFNELLEDDLFHEEIVSLIEFGLNRNKERFSNRYNDTSFVLYEKYTYEDVVRLLNWSKAEVATNIGGYKYNAKTNTFPVFINYDKEEDISESIKYQDKFISRNLLVGISKSKRRLTSPDIINIKNSTVNNTQILLFVRKNKDDKTSKEFYFLGTMKLADVDNNLKEIKMQGTNLDAVEIVYKLDVPVKEDIYDYIVR